MGIGQELQKAAKSIGDNTTSDARTAQDHVRKQGISTFISRLIFTSAGAYLLAIALIGDEALSIVSTILDSVPVVVILGFIVAWIIIRTT